MISNINIINNDSSCLIDFYEDIFNKSFSFYINNAALLSHNHSEVPLLNAYKLDDSAIIDATSFSNSLSFSIDADDIELISEDTNKLVIFSQDNPIAQISTINVVDEEGNNLRTSLHTHDNIVELIIEEQTHKASISLKIGAYIESSFNTTVYLRTFGEYDYWFDGDKRTIFKVDKYNNKTEIVKMSYSEIGSQSYLYQLPAMISETVFFNYYSKCFYKIDGSKVTKLKDEKSFFCMTYLYDDVWVTAYKNGNSYDFKLIEFTDTETATYEVLDTHTINVGKSSSEYFYTPVRMYCYNNKVAISFYSYSFDSYIPNAKDQYMSAKIDKVNKRFDFTGIEPMQILEYEGEYTLTYDWNMRKHSVDGKVLDGYLSYPLKPLALPQGDMFYGYGIQYNGGSAVIAEINLKKATVIDYNNFFLAWSTGSYSGLKSVDKKNVIDGCGVFKDEDIAKRSIRPTTQDDYIIPFESPSSSTYISVEPTKTIKLKKEVIQGKVFLFSESVASYQLYQRDNIIPSSVTVSENTDIEIRPYSKTSYKPSTSYILEEERDFNIFTSVSDIERIAVNESYDLDMTELTLSSKVDDKYSLEFAEWGEYTETFEDYPNTLIKWTKSNYNEHGLVKSDIRAKDGTYSGYMGRETKGDYSTPDYYSEFKTVGDKIEFDYYNSFKEYSQRLKVRVNDVEFLSDSYLSGWKKASIGLAPNKVNTVKILYEFSAAVPTNDKGFFIDNLICNVPIPGKDAVIYFNSVDYGSYDSPQGINIIINDLEVSSNITKAIYYSIDNGAEWIKFNNILPNVDNILLKAVFTKPTIEEEAYVRFSSVSVMPGEFEYTSYVDAFRKVYNKEDIKLAINPNNTISIESDGRYKLLFEDGTLTTESFEGENKLKYTLAADPIYGSAVITSKTSATGSKCCLLTYASYSSNYDVTRAPRIEFSTQSDKFSFKYKVKDLSGLAELRVYVNGVNKLGIYPKNTEEFIEQEIKLNPDEVSDIKIAIIAHTGTKFSFYVDDIKAGRIAPVDYSYVESEPVDLSVFPTEVNCSIEPIELQSTHDLAITNFYSVDNEEWQPLINDTLPNVANVRIKTVFTKASVDEVVDATFESIAIKHKSSEQIITTLVDINRQVVKSSTINIDTYRATLKNYISIIDAYRQVVKKYNNKFDTSRIVDSKIDIVLKADTKREVANKILAIQDMYRKINISASSKVDIKREVVKNALTIQDILRDVTHKVYKTQDMLREAIKKASIKQDILRKTIKDITTIQDSKRVVGQKVTLKKDVSREVVRGIKVELDTYRELIKAINSLNDLNRRVSNDCTAIVDTERKVEVLTRVVEYFDTKRIVQSIEEVELLLDTLRVIYEKESPFEAQLAIDLQFKNGVLSIENQEYK